MSSSLHSSTSDCNAPYSKLSQSTTDTSSLDDCMDPTEVLVIRTKPGKSAAKSKSNVIHKAPAMYDHSMNREFDAKVFDILLVAADDLATQITLMDWPVFKAITPEELTSCAWNTKSKLEKANNVVQFIRRFNHTNFWVQKEILYAQSFKSRVEILSKMIKVAKKLFELNNLNGLRAVITALLSAPIYRLEACWNSISRRDRITLNSLAELVSEEENRRRLRKHLSMTSIPCIPFLGLYLTDLVYIDTLHPHHGGMESSQRKIQMNNICRIMSEFQQSDYTFLRPLKHVQSYLLSVRYIEELQKFVEDDNYKMSLAIEPMPEKVQQGKCKGTSETVKQGESSFGVPSSSKSHGQPAVLGKSTTVSSGQMDLYSDDLKGRITSSDAASNTGSVFSRWLPSSRQKTRFNSPGTTFSGLISESHPNVSPAFVYHHHDEVFESCALAAELSSIGTNKRRLKNTKSEDETPITSSVPALNRMLRGLFCDEPHKCYPVTGRCMVVLIDDDNAEYMDTLSDQIQHQPIDGNHPHSQSTNTVCNGNAGISPRNTDAAKCGIFQLNDLNRGNIFKFKTRSSTEAARWCDQLQDVIQRSRKAYEKNLMLFD